MTYLFLFLSEFVLTVLRTTTYAPYELCPALVLDHCPKRSCRHSGLLYSEVWTLNSRKYSTSRQYSGQSPVHQQYSEWWVANTVSNTAASHKYRGQSPVQLAIQWPALKQGVFFYWSYLKSLSTRNWLCFVSFWTGPPPSNNGLCSDLVLPNIF